MPELNTEIPRILDPSFEEMERDGDSRVRIFEGLRYRFPQPSLRVIGELAIHPAGRQLRTTAKTTVDGYVYSLTLGNSQYAIEKLLSEPEDLLKITLSEGELEVDNTVDG
jgi:hypothetical protein